ncbi:MAG: DUF4231 domain-containing protein [Cyanobacteria bacterium J06626_14]
MTSEFKSSTYCSPALEDAWRRFGDFDKNANLAQKRFLTQRKWITMLGVIVTILAVLDLLLETSLNEGHWFAQLLQSSLPGQFEAIQGWVGRGLNLIIIIIPIVISILVAGAVKFNMGISWVMLRSAAESIKHEIFRYRTQVGIYSPGYVSSSGKPETRDVTLARRVKQIGKRVMETQVNMSELEIYDYKKEGLPPVYGVAPGDDGFSNLTAEQYVHWRIEDQFDYYRGKATRLAKELQRFQWSIYIIGGLGTLLAAIQMEIWVAVTSAVVAALGSFLEFKRVETNLIGMNLAASDLYDIRAWWRALSDVAKQQSANKSTLVKSAEGIIRGENASWLTEMREALSEVYGDEEDDGTSDENEDIAVLPETVAEKSEVAASATAAFDSIVRGEGDSWLSKMQSTLTNTAQSDGAYLDETASPDDEQMGEAPAPDEWIGDDAAAYDEMPYDEGAYDESAYDESAYDERAYDDSPYEESAYRDADYEFDGVSADEDSDSVSTEPTAFTEEPSDTADENWLDTPTTFDESLDSILSEDISEGGDRQGTEAWASADESNNGLADSSAESMFDDSDSAGSSVVDTTLQMDLPDGYEEDLKVFSDPLAEEFAPAPFERVAGDKPDGEEDEEDDFQSNLSDLGEFVMTPFQREPGDKPDDEEDEDDDLQSNLSDLGEFVMTPFQREPGDVPEAERESSEEQTV